MEEEESVAWLYAMLQVVIQELQMQLENRSDPGSGERVLYLRSPSWPLPEVLRGVLSEEEDEEDETD